MIFYCLACFSWEGRDYAKEETHYSQCLKCHSEGMCTPINYCRECGEGTGWGDTELDG